MPFFLLGSNEIELIIFFKSISTDQRRTWQIAKNTWHAEAHVAKPLFATFPFQHAGLLKRCQTIQALNLTIARRNETEHWTQLSNQTKPNQKTRYGSHVLNQKRPLSLLKVSPLRPFTLSLKPSRVTFASISNKDVSSSLSQYFL